MLSEGEIHVRPATPSDLDRICELEKLCFKDPYPRYFLKQLASENPATFLVATLKRNVVGYAVVDRSKDDNHLVSIAVHPEARRRGVGSRLLKALEERLEGETRLRLEVRRSNLEALQFYRKHGFHEISVVKSYYADGEDGLQMEVKIIDTAADRVGN